MNDLDDTSRCPMADACAGCQGSSDLQLVTIGTSVGVFCLTVCSACRVPNRMPGISAVLAVERSLAHCGHLGIDADQMARTMEQESEWEAHQW